MTSHGGENIMVESKDVIHPADLTKKFLSICEGSGIPASPHMGMRYISCSGETFYLGLAFNHPAGNEIILESLIMELENVKEIVVPTEHMILNEQTREWTHW